MKPATKTLLSAMTVSFLIAGCSARPTAQTAQATSSPAPALPAASETPEAVSTQISSSAQDGIEYSSVDQALSSLSSKAGAQTQVQNGWTIITEDNGLTTWSFVPTNHPAYPAVVKRVIYQQGGGWYIKTYELCGASKAACDKLLSDFETLNQQMEQYIETQKAP